MITPDVGGAFGAKMTAYREDIFLLALARELRRPVRWIATRSEDLQSSMQAARPSPMERSRSTTMVVSRPCFCALSQTWGPT